MKQLAKDLITGVLTVLAGSLAWAGGVAMLGAVARINYAVFMFGWRIIG